MRKNKTSPLCTWLVLLSLLLQLTPLQAAPPPTPTTTTKLFPETLISVDSPSQTVIGPDGTPGNLSFHVVYGEAQGTDEVTGLLRLLQREIQTAREESPALVVQTTAIADWDDPQALAEATRVAKAMEDGIDTPVVHALPKGWLSSLKSRFTHWFFGRPAFHLSFAFTALVFEGTMTMASLQLSPDIPLAAIGAMGLIMGVTAFAWMLKNSDWQKVLLNSQLASRILRVPSDRVPPWAEQMEALLKWALGDGATVALAMASMHWLGIASPQMKAGVVGFGLQTLLYDLVAEYPGEIAISLAAKLAKERLAPSDHEAIDNGTKRALLLLSAAGMAATIAQLQGVPHVQTAIWTMGGTGFFLQLLVVAVGRYPRTVRATLRNLGSCGHKIARVAQWFSRPRARLHPLPIAANSPPPNQ